jgi:hypothetical protein
LFLVPHSGECFSTLTNVHWILHIALGFVLLTPSPVSRAVRFNQIALVLITALSGPGIIILSPIALWRAYEHRDIHSRALAGIATVGAAVQTTISILNPFSWGGIGGQPFNLMAFIIDRSLGALSMPLNDGVPVINLAIALAVVTVAVITAWVRSERTLLLGMWFFCAAEMAATYARLYPVPHMAHYPVMWDRYYYIPHYVVLFSLVFAILQLRPARVLAAAGCLALFVGFRPSFMWEKLTVPHLEWAAAARQIDQGTPVDVEINPAGGKARVVLPLK